MKTPKHKGMPKYKDPPPPPKKKVYLAGKITGMEEVASKLFNEAEAKLTEEGYEVVNPMKLPHKHDKEWISYMRECHRAMTYCDCIYFLPNWLKSDGATDEAIHAAQLQLEFLNIPHEGSFQAYEIAKKHFLSILTRFSNKN